MSRGGKRNPPGGRPPKPPGEKAQKILISLPPDVVEWVRAKDNTSGYIAKLIRREMQLVND